MEDLKRLIGKKIRIKVRETDRFSYFYQGIIIEVGDTFIRLEEIKEGICFIPIKDILMIKEL